MKRRLSQDAWLVIILLVLMIVVSIATSGRDSEGGGGGLTILPRRTTYLSNPSGLKALYETLRRLNYPVVRQTEALTTQPGNGVLFIIDPEPGHAVSSEEWKNVREWVSHGNLLIVSANEYYRYEPGEKPKTVAAKPATPSFLSEKVRSLRVPADSFLNDTEWQFKEEARIGLSTQKKKTKKPDQTDAFPLLPLFGTRRETAAAFTSCGQGGVLVLCNAWPISNEGIASDDNLTMILNTLSHVDKSKDFSVTFDEYHHGYGNTPGITSLIGTPAKLGLLQLILAFLLLVFAVSRKFGRPIPLREGERPRSEYLYSMSTLLQRAKAFGAARNELDTKFREDMARYFGLPPTAEPMEIVQLAELRSPEIVRNLKELLLPISSDNTDTMNESTLLALEARRNQLRKELTKRL